MRNPFTNPPRLSPTKRSAHSCSPSRSPVRARDYDPLLRDLSPSATLRAFAAQPDELDHADIDLLVKSIQSSSNSERALGAKAAQTCIDVRSWTRELEAWEWPGTFEVPDSPARNMRMSTITSDSVFSQGTITSVGGGNETSDFWGSLPAPTALAYEKCAEEIGQKLDEVDVEELKEYVLSSHYRASSRPGSSQAAGFGAIPTDEYKKLDDFTAVVTATILQTLPYLSRLRQLLDVWALRLAVLRATPVFLRDLKRARTDLDHGWAAIAVAPASARGAQRANFSRTTMYEMKDVVEYQVSSLGTRLDRFLDHLEGREETVPESWIAEFEHLESAYGAWVVHAERKVLEDEWPEAQPKQDAAVDGSLQHSHGQPDAPRIRQPAFDSDTQAAAELVGDEVEIAHDGTSFLLDDPEGSRTASGTPRKQQALPSTFSGFDFQGHFSIVESTSLDDQRAPTPVSESAKREGTPTQVANTRAALLTNIERTNSLKQSRSPVRPFEHASNAFTRLFKPRKSEHARTRSLKSTNSKSSSTTSKEPGTPIAGEGRKSFSDQSTASSRLDSTHKRSATDTSGLSTPHALEDADAVGPIEERSEQDRHVQTPESESRAPYGHVASRASPIARPKPETYRPTGLAPSISSAPEEPAFPENWPLVSPTDTPPVERQEAEAQDEIEDDPPVSRMVVAPDPMSTDDFHDMFVQSLPQHPSPTDSLASPMGEEPGSPSIRDLPADFFRTNSLNSATSASSDSSKRGRKTGYLDGVHVGRPRASSMQSRSSRLQSIDFSGQRPVSTVLEELTTPGSLDSQSPEIVDAKSVGYFPVRPHMGRRGSSGKDVLDQRPMSTPPAGTSLSRLSIPSLDIESIYGPDDNATGTYLAPPIKRASTALIEAFPRSELKSIDVLKKYRRSTTSAPTTPISYDALNMSSISYKGMISFPTPPLRGMTLQSPPTSPIAELPFSHPSPLRSHPVSERSSLETPAAASRPSYASPSIASMGKRRKKDGALKENHPPRASTPAVSPKLVRTTPLHPGEDTFDRQVSQVLERSVSGIAFKPRPGAETPTSTRTSERRGFVGPKPKPRRLSAASKPGGGGMTLAPAESTPKKSKADVKLYHLTQAGRDEPIKLFVRLVGEGERVMVRVGGGWADLEDHLRQYAEHHGSRTVSEGNVEIQTAETVDSSAGTRKVSGKVAPMTPTSASRPTSRDSERGWLADAQPVFSMGDSSEGTTSPEEDPGHYTSPPRAGNATSTPKSTKSASSTRHSRPSTADSLRPSSRQSATDVGLSGPASGRKGELPEHKARWVEGMLERAKMASAEKAREEKDKHFGEMGKAGGTRRVVFRTAAGGWGEVSCTRGRLEMHGIEVGIRSGRSASR